MTSKVYRGIIFLIAGWSGFYVMALELLAGRILAPAFGSSIYTWGSVISLYLLALASGYLIGGRFSVNRPSLERLSLLLLAACAITLPVVLLGDAIVDALSIRIDDPRYGSFAATGALFYLPAMISGMISPYAVRLLVDDPDTSGRDAGILYFVSTFGSGAGTLGTSFYLVAWWDVSTIFWALMGVSIVIGGGALGAERVIET